MSGGKPTEEQIEDAILSARFGDLDDLRAFVDTFGKEALAEARDERGNTVLHMCCGNGHLDVLKYLLPLVPPSLLSVTNETGSPAMHYAVANNNTECVKALVNWPQEQGGGLPLLKQKNASGRDAFLESMFAGEGKEEVSGWIEGYLYKVEGGDDEEEGEGEGKEIKMSVGDEVVEDEAEVVDELVEKAEALDVNGEKEEKESD
ncbi:hypothetical protein I308_104073 [Cryptococcus tetragattii IND107]|uniref:Cytoplasmic protein n=1 Tax=Cryptococcus tetragattii IND107 TaxID=1296105 RepID=A0ABR3BPB5_9TREE|nr:cytoplasmic protein [Cryptococcus tetragattii IND107]